MTHRAALLTAGPKARSVRPSGGGTCASLRFSARIFPPAESGFVDILDRDLGSRLADKRQVVREGVAKGDVILLMFPDRGRRRR
mgnify:CR=1 FL=1